MRDRARRAAAAHFIAISQTFFVESWMVGLGAVIVLACFAPLIALSGLAVSISARLYAQHAGAPRDLLATGLVELNGWFMGLACGTFFELGIGYAVALLVAGPLVAAATIVLRRLLATWDLPVFVGPYVPAFWLLFAGVATFPWAHPAVLSIAPMREGDSALLSIVLGGARGVGQIFFVPDARVGLGLALVVSALDRRLGISMIAASIAAVGVGYLAGSPAWQVEQGLAGFTPALLAVAALRGFAGIGLGAVVVAIASSALVEAAALRLTGALGLYALSSSYLMFVWVCALLRPVRDASADRRNWSSSMPAAVGASKRARVFEDA